MAELEHARWNVERLLDGWKWGPIKDVTKKISPYILPWSALPEEMKEVDRDVVRDIPHLLAEVGMEIVRKPATKRKPSRRKPIPRTRDASTLRGRAGFYRRMLSHRLTGGYFFLKTSFPSTTSAQPTCLVAPTHS